MTISVAFVGRQKGGYGHGDVHSAKIFVHPSHQFRAVAERLITASAALGTSPDRGNKLIVVTAVSALPPWSLL